jgi:hypothetical protein
MTNADNSAERTTQRIRRTARGIGAFVAAYCLFMGIGYGIAEPEPLALENVIMTVLITTSVLGIFIGWRRERTGGTLLVVCAVAHSTFAFFAAGHNRGFAMLISGGPFLLIGALFLLAWRRSRPGGFEALGRGGDDHG